MWEGWPRVEGWKVPVELEGDTECQGLAQK